MMRFLSLSLAVILLSLPLASLGEEEYSLLGETETESLVVASEARTLIFGSEGEDVLALQKRLRELNYYRGPLSGSYLELTREAVRAVQDAYGMEATGKADAATQEIIYGDCLRPLSRGSEGEDVKRLQARLSELGYYWGKISGSYLDGTTAAVGHFQDDNALEKTGKADVTTLERLYGDDIATPKPDPAATPSPVPVPTAVPNTSYPGRLSYGSKGKSVTQLQQRLTELGFFDRKITGGFYDHTAEAVTAFQRFNGLKADGVVGEMTWEALYADGAVAASGTPKPSPEPTPVPYFIEVDVKNQLVKIFGRDDKGDFGELLKIFTCSTGTTGYPSDVGTFTLSGRKALWATFPTWGGGMARYWVRINPSIAFHSVIYDSNNLDDVNMKSVRKLGSRASHGCIRLTVHDAKWIYDNCGKGVEVWIHEDAPADPELKYAHRPGAFNGKTMLHYITPTPTAPPAPGSIAVSESGMRILKVGSEGEDVFSLQTRLRELGFYQGAVTGQFREGTQAAVKAYQKAFGLGIDGQAGKRTLEHLYREIPEASPTPGPLPTDRPEARSPAPIPSATPTPPMVFTVE